MNIEDVSGYGDKISLKLMKNYIIQFTMKRDLYRFAKARRKNREYIELNQYTIRFKYDNIIKLQHENN